MIGLQSRLEAVEGVERVEFELGSDGLEGITVRIADGADETVVLEGIRRLLVAYGTKLPRPASVIVAPEDSADETAEGRAGHRVIDLDELSEASADETEFEEEPQAARIITEDGSVVSLAVLSVGDGSVAQVILDWDGRGGRRQVPASARAVVQAVIDVGSELVGHDPISVIGMNLSSIGGTRVLTVIAGNHGSAPRVCTSSVIDQNWPGALLDVLTQVLAPVRVDSHEAL